MKPKTKQDPYPPSKLENNKCQATAAVFSQFSFQENNKKVSFLSDTILFIEKNILLLIYRYVMVH